MTNIERIRDALVSGINLAKSAGWTRHQKDEVAEAEEALRLFDEMTIQASVKSQLLSQDVGEFIAGNSQTDHIRDEYGDTHYKIDVVDVDDLRAWMSGHVRVPVETLDLMKETLEMIVEADWRKWEELSSPDEFVRWSKSRAKHALSMISAAKDGGGWK